MMARRWDDGGGRRGDEGGRGERYSEGRGLEQQLRRGCDRLSASPGINKNKTQVARLKKFDTSYLTQKTTTEVAGKVVGVRGDERASLTKERSGDSRRPTLRCMSPRCLRLALLARDL